MKNITAWTYLAFQLNLDSIFKSVKFLESMFHETEHLARELPVVIDAFNRENFSEY